MQPIKTQHWLKLVGISFVVIGLFLRVSAAVDGTGAAGKDKSKPNRLAKETSPYLLLHAHNPVDWYPWGPEAFEKAKKEGKMIFLSVGYSSCYWCHVMERKVFMNEAIAKSLNQDFVCIKVDREERPDLDDIYMTALQVYYQAIKAPGSGGWPLSIFLTPDGKPIAGGTYFPPEATEGNEGFPAILAKLTDLWKNKHDQMLGNADILANETRRLMRPKLSLKPVEVNEKLVESVFAAVAASFDPDFGGVDFNPNRPDGPKFPTPTKLSFLQQMLQRSPHEDVSKLLDATLLQLACGGIRDHVGGGFHRYSVDRRWDVPHFEKMLYDQAQLADLFTEAYRTSQRTLYKQVAEELFDFIARDMTSPEGGFYSAIDAETNGIEGEFYVWESTEIDNILGRSAVAFKDAYRVKELSDFEHGNVLRLSQKRLPKSEASNAIASSAALARSELDEFTASRKKLLEVRNKRKKPLRDEKILTCWNGLMIGAYARAAAPLNHPEYVEIAGRAAEFILTKQRDSQGRLLHTYAAGQAKLNAYLDDYAFLIDGLLALHDATEDVKWLKAAKQLQDDQLRNFLDETNGGFFFTSHHHEELLTRTKNCFDGVVPAGNSVSARNLMRLAQLTKIPNYADEARATVELFASNIEQAPRGYANLALAAAEVLEADAGTAEKTSATESKATEQEVTVVQAGGSDANKAPNDPLIVLAELKGVRKEELVTGRACLSTDRLPAGATCQFIVLLNIKEGWHINANPPQPDYLKPTKVTFKGKLGTTLSDIKYPTGHGFKFAGEDMEAMVYEGEVAIRGTLTIPEKAAEQIEDMEITINYQACNESGCQPPKIIRLTGKLPVAKKNEAVKSINARLFAPPANAQK